MNAVFESHHRQQQNRLATPMGPESEGASMRSMKRPGDNAAQLQAAANSSQHVSQLKAMQMKADEASGGLPASLRAGVEQLSGMSMEGVKVHHNSAMPAQLNAHAFAQGNEIHLAPGQEQHLPHEAWHIAQQRQGRVQANTAVAGQPVNDNAGLEREADEMGAKAVQMKAMPGHEASAAPATAHHGAAQLMKSEEAPATGHDMDIDPELEEMVRQMLAQGHSDQEILEAMDEFDQTEEAETEEPAQLKAAPIQMAKPKRKKKAKPSTPKKQTSGGTKKKTRWGGHSTAGNKKAILDIIKYRSSSVKLSIPESTVLKTKEFGKKSKTKDKFMTNGTAICHKIAESEVFKSLPKIQSEESTSNDGKKLEEFLAGLVEYVDPKHIANDNAPTTGDYKNEVEGRYQIVKKSLEDIKNLKPNDPKRFELAQVIGKNVVNNPVNLFMGASSMNSSIHENFDFNQYKDSNDKVCLSPRSARAKKFQEDNSSLIAGSVKDEKGRTKTSSIIDF